MDAIAGLQQMGLTDYEARAYAALLAHPGANGYELAVRAGVPRPKIYDALNGLVAKEAAHTSREGDRTLYHPVPHETLLRRFTDRASRLAGELGPALTELSQPQVDAPLVTVRGQNALLERAAEIAAGARHRLFVSGWPEDLQRLAPALQAAEHRGVKVYAIVYGDADLGLARSFYHSPPSPNGRLSSALPAMVVVADHAEALLAHMAPDRQATGLWTRNPGVALMAAEYVKHDVFLAEAYRRIPPDMQETLNKQTADLQEMWFLSPDEKEA